MAEIKKQTIPCPKCGKPLEIEMWDSVELPRDREQKEKIMNNHFFGAECDTCGEFIPVGYRCTYNDMERKYFLWLLPKLGEKEQQAVLEYNERLVKDNPFRLARSGYRHRVVQSVSELREKILIFDEGLDDRYIELMKMAYAPVIRQRLQTESRITDIRFQKQPDGEYSFLVIFDNRPPANVLVDMDTYNGTGNRMENRLEPETPGNLICVNAGWAAEVMGIAPDRQQNGN